MHGSELLENKINSRLKTEGFFLLYNAFDSNIQSSRSRE